MIFLIHGDNVSKSRETILQIQKKLNATHKITLNLDDTSPANLQEKASSFDLFAEPPFIIFDISSAGRKTLKEYTKTLTQLPQETNLVIYSDKELGKSNDFICEIKRRSLIKNVTQLGIKNLLSNSAPTHNIFKFLDALYEKNSRQTYRELQNLVVDEEDPIYIFTMLIYGLRNVTLAKFNSPLLKSVPPFVKSKVARQANNFSENQLKNLYTLGYDCDLKIKTGQHDPNVLVTYFIEKVLA